MSMITLISLLNHALVKMLFTISLAVWSKKVNAVVMWWKNILTKHAMANEDNEDFEISTKCWICDNNYIDCDVKVRKHCH